MTNWGSNPGPWDFKRNLNELASAALWNGPDKIGNRITKRNFWHVVGINLFFWATYRTGLHFGRWLKNIDRLPNGDERPLNYRTPVMFGNSDRAPLFPWKPKPFPLDFEECFEYYRRHDHEYTETILLYKTFFLHSWFHPGREASDDSIIATAEHHADIYKRLNE